MNSSPKRPYTKLPKSFSEQVQLLQQRGLIIDDPTEAEYYLSHLNYYRFYAYCLPFEQNHEQHLFIEGTRFEQVLNLYIFDRELRLLLLDAIERIEVSLRTQMAYHLSHNCNTAHPHLNSAIFKDRLKYLDAIKKLADDVRNSNEDFIKHLTRNYSEHLPPIWAVVELMTMGQLSKWFSNILRRSNRQAISAAYHLDETILTSYCEHLSLVRNHAAHHSRLWNRDFTKTMKLPINADINLISSLHTGTQNDRQLRKIYNTLVMTGYLIDIINPNHDWKQRLKNLIDRHGIDTHKMGFPNNWQNRPIWQLPPSI